MNPVAAHAPAPQASPSCPVCGERCDGPPQFNYTVERAALHFCPPWRDQDRHEKFLRCLREIWPEGWTRILKCSGCGFSFGDPFVGGNETFYRILHEQMGYPPWRWDYDAALAEPEIACLSGGRALDIGAGSGVFLEHLGPAWETHAVESSELTRAALARKGIPAHESLDAPALQALEGTFDLITMFQVLEHVAEFYPLLARCRALLKPGGILFVTVPDGDAMAAQERMTGCPDMPPNHIGRWSASSLAHALRHAGLAPGSPLNEPSGLRHLGPNLYLAVLADAVRPNSLAGKIYRIRRKIFRAPLLRFVAGSAALLRMLHHGRALFRGGAFALAATRNSP